MSDIFREVDEDVRRDKAAEFWSQYQVYIYVAAALIVLATAGYRFYEYRRTLSAEAAGAAFQQALKLDAEGKTADAKTSFAQLQNDAPAGYRVLARFAEAASVVKSDPKAGAEAYDALANDSSVDPLFREAARLRAALARLDAGDVTGAKGALETLASPTGTYRNTARLALGALALKDKDYKAAGTWLDQVVADPQAPQTERASAETLLGVVASNAPAK
jgi:hypothetical protein